MPKQIILAMMIEGVLMSITALLLVQPHLVFRKPSNRIKSMATWSGGFLLCITFCWSFLLGCIVALNEITTRI